jgi:hypothetical protein
MSQEVNPDRRRLIRSAVATVAVTQVGTSALAYAQSGNAKAANLLPIKPGTNVSIAEPKPVETGILNIGYANIDLLPRPSWKSIAITHMQSARNERRTVRRTCPIAFSTVHPGILIGHEGPISESAVKMGIT